MSVGKRVAKGTARARRVFSERPAAGQFTKRATARLLGESWQTEVMAGEHRLLVDQPPALGGDDSGPNPGDLLRSSLAACLAQAYAMHAERCGVQLDGIDVTVESDVDLRKAFGAESDAPAGFIAMRYTAALTTDSPPDNVQRLHEMVERTNATLDDLRRPLDVEGKLQVRARTGLSS
jgi:uncharacterized OsmC-like protein